MSDNELLELAAKAAGYKWSKKIAQEREPLGIISLWLMPEDGSLGSTAWNPLNDDGDALRLAASLNLCVCFTLAEANPTFGTAMVGYYPWENKVPISTERYSDPSEKLAATRRAIVRAAAEIGKSMQP